MAVLQESESSTLDVVEILESFFSTSDVASCRSLAAAVTAEHPSLLPLSEFERVALCLNLDGTIRSVAVAIGVSGLEEAEWW